MPEGLVVAGAILLIGTAIVWNCIFAQMYRKMRRVYGHYHLLSTARRPTPGIPWEDRGPEPEEPEQADTSIPVIEKDVE